MKERKKENAGGKKERNSKRKEKNENVGKKERKKMQEKT